MARVVKVLGDSQERTGDPERVVAAIKRAGELRAVEAVDGLVALLTFAQTFRWEQEQEELGVVSHTNTMTTGSRYPAVRALFQIGEPALPALVDHIQDDQTDPLARKNATESVMLIFREAPRKGICYFKAAAAKASSPTAMHWLEEAAESGRKWLPPDSPLPACP